MTSDLSLRVNGRTYKIVVEDRRTLVDVLRDDCGLTGTHIGCGHGVCGACTILVDGQAIRGCLMFAVQAAGCEIRTVEGLSDGHGLNPLQAAFHECHALQCGFCTPGFLMLATELLEREAELTEQTVRDVLASNLCRCTGYENIVKAVMLAGQRRRGNA